MEQNKQKIKLPKFANLLSDSGFKAVLMSPRNKNLLKELLNLVLPEDRKIEEIESYNDREIDGITPSSRYSRLDLRCRDTQGRDFIIEMQRKMHDYFFERCMWYSSNVYGHDLVPSDNFSKLKPVFLIAFLEGKLPHEDESIWGSEKFVSCYRMTEKSTGEVAPDTIMCIFVELGWFRKHVKELEGTLDKTCYVFKNVGKWKDNVPQEVLSDRLTDELTKACEVASFPEETKLSYIRDMFTEMDYRAEIKAYFDEGMEKGIEKGMEKGVAKGIAKEKMAAATRMLSRGLSAELVADCTGLSIDEVYKLTE